MRILKWIVVGALLISLFGLVTMMLWNWLVPDLFNGPVISFWQALGLVVLSKILFGGLGGKSNRGGHAHWKHRYKDKLAGMTPEERERFKEKMKEKWCSPDRHSGE